MDPGTRGRGAALEPLDRHILIRRSLEISPTGYITVISILQGVAAAILAERTYQGVKTHSAPEPLIWVQAVAVLLILTIIFHPVGAFVHGRPSPVLCRSL